MNDASGGLAPQQNALPQPGAAARLADGCYLIKYSPVASRSCLGTLRVETTTGRMIASGDFYRSVGLDPDLIVPDPQQGIPIFPISAYCYYLRITDIHPFDGGVDLSIDLIRYLPEGLPLLDESQTNWLLEDTLTARMLSPPPPEDPLLPPTLFPPPDAFPSPQFVFGGALVNSSGTAIGILSMGLVSPFLRKATVEFNCVEKAHIPHDNAAGETLVSIFRKIGWDLTVTTGDVNVQEPGGESWNSDEADAAMAVRRQRVNFDAAWHYDVLAVRKIDHKAMEDDPQDVIEDNGIRGHMYQTRREGLMIAARYMIPDTPKWGFLRGMPLGATTAYFRTAVHELGHALNLSHNAFDNGFMNPTDAVAATGTADLPFPLNVLWSFAPDDQHRLRHWPDVMVRSAASGFGGGGTAPSARLTADAFTLEAAPVEPSVRFGAPVRIHVVLRNTTKDKLFAPPSLGLKAGYVSGRVIDPAGVTRAFTPFLVHARGDVVDFDAGTSREDTLTLFAGPDGDLFPAPGIYRIVVDANWHGPPKAGALMIDIGVSAETTVTVMPA